MLDSDELTVDSIVKSALRDHALIANEMASQIVAQVDAYQHVPDPQEVLLDTERSCDDAHPELPALGRTQQRAPRVGFHDGSVAERVRQRSRSRPYSTRTASAITCSGLISGTARADAERGEVALNALVDPMLRYIDAVSTVVAEGYLREQQHALADADGVSVAMCSSNCSRRRPRLWISAAAQGIDLDADAPHHVLLARRAVAEQGDLRAICNEIARLFASDAPLVVIRQETATALVRGDDLSTLDRARRLADVFVGTERIRVGVSLTSTISRLGEAYRQAERALQVAGDAEPVVALGGMASINYLVASADEVARALVPAEVARLASSSARQTRC